MDLHPGSPGDAGGDGHVDRGGSRRAKLPLDDGRAVADGRAFSVQQQRSHLRRARAGDRAGLEHPVTALDQPAARDPAPDRPAVQPERSQLSRGDEPVLHPRQFHDPSVNPLHEKSSRSTRAGSDICRANRVHETCSESTCAGLVAWVP